MGYSGEPRTFCKVMKLLVTSPSSNKADIAMHIDDTLIIESSYDACQNSTKETSMLFGGFELTVHPGYLSLTPPTGRKGLGKCKCCHPQEMSDLFADTGRNHWNVSSHVPGKQNLHI